jgi:hypothetical protein
MRGIQNPISPIIAAAVLAALLCLPVLGNISFNTSKLEARNRFIYNKMTMESKRVNSP